MEIFCPPIGRILFPRVQINLIKKGHGKLMREIILASASPRRSLLLKQWGIPFRVVSSNIDEESLQFEGDPWERAEKLALTKAINTADKVKSGLILGADTIVVLNNIIYGKPNNADDAYNMLKSLRDKCHEVITGVAVVNGANGFHKTAHEVTKILFTAYDENDISNYLKTGEFEGKAGGYAIQGMGSSFVKEIQGCYTNVVGLPFITVKRLLNEFDAFTDEPFPVSKLI